MNLRLAQFLSVLFHPAIYPLFGLFFVFRFLPYHYPQRVIIVSLLMVFCGTYLIPVLISVLLYRFRVISSLMMTKASDRRWPYLVGVISFYATAQLVQNAGLASEAYHYLLGASAVIILHLFLLNFLKPSAHLGGIGGFLGMMLAISAKYTLNLLPFIVGLILISGLIASARLSLKAHNPREILIGFSSGLLIVFTTVYFL
jgi:membrane-associated phospholipid phosphatase